MQESVLIEVIPLLCKDKGQYCVLSHPVSLQGASSGVAEVAKGLAAGSQSPSWCLQAHHGVTDGWMAMASFVC